MTKPVLYEWARDQTSLPPTTQSQWEKGFTYLDSATGGKVTTYVHDYPFSEITKAVRWTLDALPDNGFTSAYVENRFKGNQNPVAKGKDGHPLPSATPTTYPAGDEIAAGIIAFTTVVDLTYVNGVYSAESGIMRRLYAKDSAGLVTKSNQYAGIKMPDGSQLQASVDDIAINGVRVTEEGSDIVVDVDLSSVTDGFRFFGLSDERGSWANVNDKDSFRGIYSDIMNARVERDVTSSRPIGVNHVNDTPVDLEVTVSYSATPGIARFTFETNSKVWTVSSQSSTASISAEITKTIPPGGYYKISNPSGNLNVIQELRYP